VKSIQALRRKGTPTVDWLVNMLQTYPEFATFFVLAIGFWIGPRKIAGLSLGNVTATLLAALIIGQLAITIPPNVRFVFFLLFLFAVGRRGDCDAGARCDPGSCKKPGADTGLRRELRSRQCSAGALGSGDGAFGSLASFDRLAI
jgi:hypothetical protein